MTSRQYLLAIDAGTTSVKTVLFDTAGREIACRVCEYSLEKPEPDVIEVHPEVYWTATRDGIAGVLIDSAVAPEDIVAVGVTSQGETLIALDKNGAPVRKAIVWLDNRAKAEAAQIAERFSRKEVYRITGQQEIVPTWTAAKILWMRNNEPELFSRTAKFLMVEDYLISRLTGKFATDHALNPSTLYYNLVDGCWWQEMLDFLEISQEQLPELLNSGESAGNALLGTGLSPITQVCVAPIDQVAAAVGAGNISPGMVTETTGSAMAICATVETLAYDKEMRVGLYRHAVPGLYVMMPWIPTAGMILRWFRDELASELSYDDLSCLAGQIPVGSDGLLMLPYLSGTFCPDVNPDAKGVFYGISLSHKQGHFIRAIFESVAFLLRHNIEVLESCGVNCSEIRSLGGGARDDVWLRIKADVLHRPFVIPKCEEATCLGTAILAGVGAEVFSSLNEAVGRMVQIKMRMQPQAERIAEYEKIYQEYLKINRLMLPSFTR